MDEVNRRIASEFWKQMNGNISMMAREANLDRHTVRAFLNGKSVSLPAILKMCNVLGLKLKVEKDGKDRI